MVRTQGKSSKSYHWQSYINQKLPYSIYNLEENRFTVRFRGILTQRTGFIPQFMRGLSFTANIQKGENRDEAVRFVVTEKSQCASIKVGEISLINI